MLRPVEPDQQHQDVALRPIYVDQYSLATRVRTDKQERTGSEFVRERSLRDAALDRAQGICELWGAEGFTRAGAVFSLNPITLFR
jgi:hypothetical protein